MYYYREYEYPDEAYLDKIDKLEEMRNRLHITDNQLAVLIKEDAYCTTKIEGNLLSRREITYLLEKNVTVRGKSFGDFAQARGVADMAEVIKAVLYKNEIRLSTEVICTIHGILTKGELSVSESGFLRTEPVHIRGTNYIPPSEWEIEEVLNESIQKYYRPLQLGETQFDRICEWKENFERIHPFIDGNGRTGRLLMNLLFLQHGYGYIIIPVEERDLYFDAIENHTLREYILPKMEQCMQELQVMYKEYNINKDYEEEWGRE